MQIMNTCMLDKDEGIFNCRKTHLYTGCCVPRIRTRRLEISLFYFIFKSDLRVSLKILRMINVHSLSSRDMLQVLCAGKNLDKRQTQKMMKKQSRIKSIQSN